MIMIYTNHNTNNDSNVKNSNTDSSNDNYVL